jgi:hypothetical protein
MKSLLQMSRSRLESNLEPEVTEALVIIRLHALSSLAFLTVGFKKTSMYENLKSATSKNSFILAS